MTGKKKIIFKKNRGINHGLKCRIAFVIKQ